MKDEPKAQERLLTPIKAMIEENPSFGYRTVAHLLEFNKNTVQRMFQLKVWQVTGSSRSASGRALRLCLQWQSARTNAGRRICAVSGRT